MFLIISSMWQSSFSKHVTLWLLASSTAQQPPAFNVHTIMKYMFLFLGICALGCAVFPVRSNDGFSCVCNDGFNLRSRRIYGRKR